MKQKWKYGIILAMAFFSPFVTIAGCSPLILTVYTSSFINKIHRGLLFLVTCLGIVLFLPVNDMVKYLTAVVSVSALLWLTERILKSIPSLIAASVSAAIVCVLVLSQQIFLVMEERLWWQGVLEGIFILGAVMIMSRLLYLLEDSRPKRQQHPIQEESQVLKREQQQKAQVCADSVLALSKAFEKTAVRQKQGFSDRELSRLSGEMTGRVCMACSQCDVCWEEKHPPMQEKLISLLQTISREGDIREEEVRELDQECICAGKMVEEALHIMECASLNQAWYNRLQENKSLISWQLDTVADMIEKKFNGETDVSSDYRPLLKEIGYSCWQRGITVKMMEVKEKRDGHLKLILLAQAKRGRSCQVKEISAIISRILGQEMISHRENRLTLGSSEAELVFEEAPLYKELHGMAKIVKDNAQVSGDNFSFCSYEEGEINLCLSDGMGSGMEACKESEMVLELIEKFLEAGFPQELAVRMMSSSMMLHSSKEQFSTIDIAGINLYSGLCRLYKIGAAATFIRRKETVECMVSTNLPVGILQQMEIEIYDTVLEDGDFVVLVSDGVLEHLNVDEPEETMKEIIGSIRTNHPGNFTKEILKHVMVYTGGEVKDDMTVLAAGIWKR
ncbi:MAG: SpoIIE family protein phosphatase [Eubacterium sp.]|nr:SpoIIE family protein phosphatase [Eubacterium sp.]